MITYFKNPMNKIKINLTKNISVLFLAIISFIILTVSSACDEEINSLGSELMPNGDKIEVLYDSSFTFKSKVLRNDAIRTSNLQYYTLGIINDPYFGSFIGSYAGQFLPVFTDTISKITSYNIDSLVLYVAIDSIYGNPFDNIEFNLFELSSPLNEDSSYYSDAEVSTLYNETDKISRSFEYWGDSLAVFVLENDFAERLLSDTLFYESDTSFKDEFEGLAIIPSLHSSNGGTININLSSSDTKFTLYHSNDTVDSLSLDYSVLSNRFAQYEYNYTGSQVETYLNNAEDENDDLMFLQGGTGLYSRIQLTNIAPWISDTINYSILNANLTMPVYNDDNINIFSPPEKLTHYFYDDDSIFYYTDDYLNLLNGKNYSFDGKHNEEEQYYHFDISRHLMNIMNRLATDSCINITIVDQTKYPHRVILKTGDDIKLKITYTKHKN